MGRSFGIDPPAPRRFQAALTGRCRPRNAIAVASKTTGKPAAQPPRRRRARRTVAPLNCINRATRSRLRRPALRRSRASQVSRASNGSGMLVSPRRLRAAAGSREPRNSRRTLSCKAAAFLACNNGSATRGLSSWASPSVVADAGPRRYLMPLCEPATARSWKTGKPSLLVIKSNYRGPAATLPGNQPACCDLGIRSSSFRRYFACRTGRLKLR